MSHTIETHLELHVASARSLSSSRRDLFTEIRSWDDLLCQRHSVVLQIDQLQTFANDGVIVDHSAHIVE